MKDDSVKDSSCPSICDLQPGPSVFICDGTRTKPGRVSGDGDNWHFHDLFSLLRSLLRNLQID